MPDLRPSEIYYSQDQISAHFGRSTCHAYQPIGGALDKLCNGEISVCDIQKIKVTKKGDDGKWYTVDNRRLWIFRYLEGAGKCSRITCEEVEFCELSYGHKFSSSNGGKTVTFIRDGDPGGEWHKRIRPANPSW